ncbi:MAG: nitrile hydratase subunit beta [Acidimicrobiaceae bacterium]|jgi:nitrile hydratase|nr:nitrile hydratase subunit beta [Acidimicrobiaceae bacterium]
MDGAHDMGGMHGFGPVHTPDGDLVVHEAWEPRAQMVGLMSKASGGSMRPHIEALAPAEYLALSYYARWLVAAENLHVAAGSVTADDLRRWYEHFEANPEAVPPRRDDPRLTDLVKRRLSSGRPLPRPVTSRFAPNDVVIVQRMRPNHHNRCPRYVRGARGTIDVVCGEDRMPGAGQSERTEPVYTVRFESRELWGRTDEPPFVVFVDLWESYLEPVP